MRDVRRVIGEVVDKVTEIILSFWHRRSRDSKYECRDVPTVGERKQSTVHPLRGRGAGKTEELEKLGRMRRMKYQTYFVELEVKYERVSYLP